MIGYEIPHAILSTVQENKDVTLYSHDGKPTTLATGVMVARLLLVEDHNNLSDAFRKTMESMNIPFILIKEDLSGCKEYFPSCYFENPPYEGRPYIYGLMDCYTLFKDWYEKELKINIPWNIHRPYGWWEQRSSLYFEYMKQAGFANQSGVMQRGDVILFSLGGSVTNHVAIYLGNGEILHHLGGKFSCKEKLKTSLNNSKTAICRYVA